MTLPIPLLDVDATQIEQQLAAAEDARDHLNRIIGWLEDGVALFTPPAPPQLPGPATPEPAGEDEPLSPETPPRQEEEAAPVAPPAGQERSAPKRAGRAGMRDLEAKVLHVLVKANHPLSKDDIATLAGVVKSAVDRPLRKLIAAGTVEATGATKRRRYANVQQTTFHTEARERREVGVARNRAKIEGRVERVVFRDKVAKAIAGQPGQTIDELTGAVDADRDDVAEACTWLVDHRLVQLADEGTYSRQVAGRARLRAAA